MMCTAHQLSSGLTDLSTCLFLLAFIFFFFFFEFAKPNGVNIELMLHFVQHLGFLTQKHKT